MTTLRTLALSSALFGALLVFAGPTGCSDGEGITLPPNYNTGRYRELSISPNDKCDVAAGLCQGSDTVKALSGMHGSPRPVVAGDADLRTRYWGRLTGSQEDDGAHLRLVRVGTDTLCGVSLESIFPDKTANANNPTSYDFATLDQRIKAATELNTASVMWEAAFNPGSACKADSEGHQSGEPIVNYAAAGQLWAEVAFNTLRHLRGTTAGPAWAGDTPKGYSIKFVEFMRDPIGRLGYPSNANDAAWTALFQTYDDFASRVKTEWPDTTDTTTGVTKPRVYVGGMSWHFTPTDLGALSGGTHPVIAFMDFVDNGGVPLDFLSFSTTTTHPFQAFEIAAELRAKLDSRGMTDVQLIATGTEPNLNDPALSSQPILQNAGFRNAHLGAFQTAARIFYQDVPVVEALAGRGPRVLADLQPHTGEPLSSLTSLIVDSDYFEANGTPKPAFMMLFPWRQIPNHQRVRVGSGADEEGFAILASHEQSSDNTLHVLIANANVHTGKAAITYDLVLESFVPPTIRQVEYRLAILDRTSDSLSDFIFTEVGVLESTSQSGSIRFVHEMAVPSIHYLQFVKRKACNDDNGCLAPQTCNQGFCS